MHILATGRHHLKRGCDTGLPVQGGTTHRSTGSPAGPAPQPSARLSLHCCAGPSAAYALPSDPRSWLAMTPAPPQQGSHIVAAKQLVSHGSSCRRLQLTKYLRKACCRRICSSCQHRRCKLCCSSLHRDCPVRSTAGQQLLQQCCTGAAARAAQPCRCISQRQTVLSRCCNQCILRCGLHAQTTC
jgi:hypothetical protein